MIEWRTTTTRDDLYEQADLGQMLDLSPDLRTRYISIVLRPDVAIRRQLVRETLEWTKDWDPELRYIQGVQGLHSTVIEFGPLGNLEKGASLTAMSKGIESLSAKPTWTVTLSKAKLGGSGINREVKDVNSSLQEVLKGLAKQLGVMEESPRCKSISLVRYLIRNDLGKIRELRGLLDRLSREQTSDEMAEVPVESLALISVDKVAFIFDVLAETHPCR